MIKIRIKATGETQEVTRNVAHDLIDSGRAELVKPPVYDNRVLKPTREISKKPKREISKYEKKKVFVPYKNRQMQTPRTGK